MFVMQAYRLAIESISDYAGSGLWRERYKHYFAESIAHFHEQGSTRQVDFMAMLDSEDFYVMIAIILLEAFLEHRFPEPPENLVEDYIKRRGWQISKLSRQILLALQQTANSLFEVLECPTENTVTIRDFLFPFPPVTVQIFSMTQRIPQGELFVSKVFRIESDAYLPGCLLPIDRETGDAIKMEVAARLQAQGMTWPIEPESLQKNAAAMHPVRLALLGELTPVMLGAGAAHFLTLLKAGPSDVG